MVAPAVVAAGIVVLGELEIHPPPALPKGTMAALERLPLILLPVAVAVLERLGRMDRQAGMEVMELQAQSLVPL